MGTTFTVRSSWATADYYTYEEGYKTREQAMARAAEIKQQNPCYHIWITEEGRINGY